MRKVHSAPFCIGAGQRRGTLSGLLQKWKREVCGRAGNRSHISVLHHVHGPTPPPAYVLRWVMFWFAAKATPLPCGASGRAEAVTVADPGASSSKADPQQLWHRAGSQVSVLQRNWSCSRPGTAGCSHSSVTSPPLAILGYCPAFEAGRKIASSTAVPFSTASPLLARVTNVTGQVTQNANISG